MPENTPKTDTAALDAITGIAPFASIVALMFYCGLSKKGDWVGFIIVLLLTLTILITHIAWQEKVRRKTRLLRHNNAILTATVIQMAKKAKTKEAAK